MPDEKVTVESEGSPEVSPTWCYICKGDVGWSSHYHCPNCWGRCSMMGHLAPDLGYSCEKQPDPRGPDKEVSG